MRNRILILVLIAALAGGVVFATAAQRPDPDRFEASGTIEATEVHVGAQVGGSLTELKIEEGDRVEKDERLAKIDDSIAVGQVRGAEAALDAANARVENIPSGTTEYRALQAGVKQAQAALDIARAQMGFTSIKAPISGRVLSVPFARGENLAPGSTVAVLADLDHLKVTVYVPETDLGKVKIGHQAKISVDSFPGKKFTGRITAIASKPEFTPTNVQTKEQRVKQVYAVTIRVKNRDDRLKPGMPADIGFALN